MLTVDDYGRIRRAHRDGMSIREIAGRFHHSRRKIREVLRGAGQPRQYPKRQRQSAPRLGPFHDRILQILADDESQPPKQRHTAMRLFERLRDEHSYAGGYDAVRRFVKKHRSEKRETFIPLDHDCGQRLEADFGKIYVDFPDGRRQVSVLILVWSYSNAPFAIALPTERTEAILEGMVQGVRIFRMYSARSVVGQPEDRGGCSVERPRPQGESTIRGPGEPLRVRADVLYGGERQ